MSPTARSLKSIRNNHRNSRPHLDPETEQNRVYKQLQRGTSFRCSFSSIKPGLLCGKWTCPACRLRLSARWMRSARELLDDAHERGERSYKLVLAHPDAQHVDEARRRFERFQRLLRKRHPGCRLAWSLGGLEQGLAPSTRAGRRSGHEHRVGATPGRGRPSRRRRRAGSRVCRPRGRCHAAGARPRRRLRRRERFGLRGGPRALRQPPAAVLVSPVMTSTQPDPRRASHREDHQIRARRTHQA